MDTVSDHCRLLFAVCYCRSISARLSVLGLHERLELGQHSLLGKGVRAISMEAVAFKDGKKMMHDHAASVSEYFLWFGRNEFSYDGSRFIMLAANLARCVNRQWRFDLVSIQIFVSTRSQRPCFLCAG